METTHSNGYRNFMYVYQNKLKWLVAWRHQAITWTDVDLKWLVAGVINLKATALQILEQVNTTACLKISYPNYIPRGSEL